ncbi:MAG: hypothetical protein DWH96_06970 [Planctomycetota bacterium]|nr:MAG: hypothetical protein DWH96_06970 [Planctomycetota bacterium]RLS93700.1 MAG: hypothetical protein DWI11_06430 [Planctomycetota bacterium]
MVEEARAIVHAMKRRSIEAKKQSPGRFRATGIRYVIEVTCALSCHVNVCMTSQQVLTEVSALANQHA